MSHQFRTSCVPADKSVADIEARQKSPPSSVRHDFGNAMSRLIGTFLAAIFLVGCGDAASTGSSPQELVEGGVYAVKKNEIFYLMKIFKIQYGSVHYRVFSGEYSTPPGNISTANLPMILWPHVENIATVQKLKPILIQIE